MSQSLANPSPANATGATSPISAEAVARSIATLLRPLVKLAIKAGLKYAELDQLLREALFEEAQKQCSDKDRSNASKLSMMTGLHRKDVGARLTQPELAKPIDQKLDKHSAARRVFAKWLHLLRRNPQRKELPISSNSKRVSNFYDLVRENISDVHPRAVLDELVRLGLVIESGELVSISKTNFIEKSSTNEKMPVFTHNLNAHLMTSVGNILASRPAQLERAIWIENISKIDA
ncbi:MAG: DUF6502 family protein, partial [Casimicrobium sp.]